MLSASETSIVKVAFWYSSPDESSGCLDISVLEGNVPNISPVIVS